MSGDPFGSDGTGGRARAAQPDHAPAHAAGGGAHPDQRDRPDRPEGADGADGAAPSGGGLMGQPRSVWATAGAAVVAFMGIGLVDPILPSIAQGLRASPSQVSLLFTSYFLITAVAMLVTGFVSSRIGGRRTLLAGLALVVVFAALSGTSGSVGALVGFRAGWGLGNALFVSTALAVIVGAARPAGGRHKKGGPQDGSAAAILLYESALGLGMACGPLLGAVLGGWKWRYPFFGTATLMAVGFVAISVLLEEQPKPAVKTSLLDPLRALGHGGLASAAASAFFYNYAFFTVLAFTPFVLDMSPYRSGAVFFAWGVLLAVFSVLVAPRLQRRLGTLRVLGGSLVLMAADLVVLGYGNHTAAIVCTVLSGAFIGVNNTVFTELALGVSDAPRPVASAGYNFVRWFAAAAAPYLAPKIEEWTDASVPFAIAAAAALVGALVVGVRRSSLRHGSAGAHSSAQPQPQPQAQAPARPGHPAPEGEAAAEPAAALGR